VKRGGEKTRSQTEEAEEEEKAARDQPWLRKAPLAVETGD